MFGPNACSHAAMVESISAIFEEISRLTVAVGKPRGRATAGDSRPVGKYPNSSTTKVATRCPTVGRFNRGADGSNRENPFVVPV